MSQELLQDLMHRSEALSLEEQAQLVNHLQAKARDTNVQSDKPRRKLSEFKGLATYPLVGEDAQAWVSRSRQEDTDR